MRTYHLDREYPVISGLRPVIHPMHHVVGDMYIGSIGAKTRIIDRRGNSNPCTVPAARLEHLAGFEALFLLANLSPSLSVAGEIMCRAYIIYVAGSPNHPVYCKQPSTVYIHAEYGKFYKIGHASRWRVAN